MDHETIQVAKKKNLTPLAGAARPNTSNRYDLAFKLRAVKLFLEEGFTRSAIAAELHIAIGTLDRWVVQYRRFGEQGLEGEATGPVVHSTANAPARLITTPECVCP